MSGDDHYSKGIMRTAIAMNPNLAADEKQRLLGRLRDGYSSHVLPEMPPGVIDAKIAKMFAADPEMARLAQEAAVTQGAERQQILKTMRKMLHKQTRAMEREKAENARQRDFLKRSSAALKEVIEWQGRPIVLQRPEGSLLPKLRAAAETDEVYCTTALTGPAEHEKALALYEEGWKVATSFVVEHDWAGAFANAADFDGGDFPLPAPICLFEFRISGLPVLVLATQLETEGSNLCLVTAVRSRHGWVVNGAAQRTPSGAFVTRSVEGGLLMPIPPDVGLRGLTFLADQIRAVSIALDAEVAKASPVRAPHRSNQPPRGRRPLPEYSYHVLSLARRSRAEPAERDPNAEPGRRRRLHFRRGHWRHYATSKTWINWMLVGDPDLGFVDKHYKL